MKEKLQSLLSDLESECKRLERLIDEQLESIDPNEFPYSFTQKRRQLRKTKRLIVAIKTYQLDEY